MGRNVYTLTHAQIMELDRLAMRAGTTAHRAGMLRELVASEPAVDDVASRTREDAASLLQLVREVSA